ncbi:MAG: pucI [Bacillota bacterium]|nr:pucI [Bacillota bacterium]
MSKYTQKESGGLYELTDAARAELSSSKFYNEDLAPTPISERSWSTYHIAMLWVGMSVCIPSFTMASSLVALGLSPWMAVFNVALGNILILIPIQLNSHAGTKYGLPFPVFARLAFGPVGAHLPSLSRALTACGWNAVQSWIGGAAIVSLVAAFVPAFGQMAAAPFIGFGIFLLLTWWVTVMGSESIKYLEAIGSPVLIVLTIMLFVWSIALASGGGYSFGDLLQATTDTATVNASGGFLYVFLGGLTANIAFWATMALNIPDFSRYAKSQKSQFRGQLYGMPVMMAACAFIGAIFAQATKLVMGTAMFDPTAILPLIDNAFIKFLVSIGVILATITTNIAANVVAPANGFSNVSPKRISYKMGVTISCLLAVLYRPWWIFGGAGSYIFGWLNTYGGILAPVAAIFIADYYIVKKRNIDVMALFQGKEGRYWYQNGWNIKALIAWVLGFILPTMGNLGVASLKWVAANGYIIGFVIAFVTYILLMKNDTISFVSDEEEEAMTER